MNNREVSNRTIAGMLHRMGQLLEILDENPFKIRSYARASDVIGRLAAPVVTLSKNELEAINGIGNTIATNIQEIVETGSFKEHEEAMAKVPAGLPEMLDIDGVGPKTVKTLWKKLRIENVDDLERAARGHRIRAVKGFGEKKERAILASIARHRQSTTRMNRLQAGEVIEIVGKVMEEGTYTVAGSYRRKKSTIGDIDIVTRESPSVLNPALRGIAEEMIESGEKKTSFRCKGSRVDIRYARPSICGSMLLYLTGSKAFNIRMREIALSKGMKLNEYGLADLSSGRSVEFASEAELFSFLGMDYIVPELREDWGEVEAALSHSLPSLVNGSHIRGDLHVHSTWSDGQLGIRDLANAGERMGYTYLLCTDHSSSLGIARGLDEAGLRKQAHEIEVVNRTSMCQVLHGVEVDILADGSAGLPLGALKDLDLVIGSVHSAFSQEEDVMTRRVLSAIANEHIDIIGHPTGRLLGQREAYAIDMQRIIESAAAAGTALECNASPYRMDLDDIHIREATGRGVKISIGTDSHAPAELAFLDFGLGLCRRGWAGPEAVLNTFEPRELMEWAS